MSDYQMLLTLILIILYFRPLYIYYRGEGRIFDKGGGENWNDHMFLGLSTNHMTPGKGETNVLLAHH